MVLFQTLRILVNCDPPQIIFSKKKNVFFFSEILIARGCGVNTDVVTRTYYIMIHNRVRARVNSAHGRLNILFYAIDAIALCLHRSFTNRANSRCGGGDDEGKGGTRRAYTRYRATIIG